MMSTDFDKIANAVGIDPTEMEWLMTTVQNLQKEAPVPLSVPEIIEQAKAVRLSMIADRHDLRAAAFVSSGGHPRYYGRNSRG
jgi:hypothetical protein